MPANCPQPDCPIDPEFWKTLGGIAQSLKDGEARMSRIETDLKEVKSDVKQLNHIRVRGAQYGAGAGTAAGVVSAGILVWLKSKLG